jgi:RNA polymerase sigma-70 factor, ECF subfamily
VGDRFGWRLPLRGRPRFRLPWPRRAPRPASDDSWAWVEPYPGPFSGPPAPSMSLAFVAALQGLPPDERAAVVLTDVLDFGPGEVAEILGRQPADLDRLLARARGALAGVVPRQAPPAEDAAPAADQVAGPAEDAVLARFTGAFDRGDVPGMTALLADDAWLRMRPLPVQYQGRGAAGHFLATLAFPGGTTRYRLVVTRANGQPAFGCYLRDPAAGVDRACGLVVLTLDGDRITAIDRFVDNSAMARFGLPRTLPGQVPT